MLPYQYGREGGEFGPGLRADLFRIEVKGPHVGALRSTGIPVVVSRQDDVIPAQG